MWTNWSIFWPKEGQKHIHTIFIIFSLLSRLQGNLWAIQYLVRPLNLGHQNLHGFKNRIKRIEKIHQLHCDCFGIYQRRWWSQKSGSHSRYWTRYSWTSLFCESLGHVSRFDFGFMVIYHYILFAPGILEEFRREKLDGFWRLSKFLKNSALLYYRRGCLLQEFLKNSDGRNQLPLEIFFSFFKNCL